MDACIAMASARKALPGFCVPEFWKERRVLAENVTHPLLKNPVSNTFDWKDNVLVTGSNASGKSTFVKAVAVNAVLAQSVCTCWAQRFQMPRAQVLSSMAIRDNVQGGESYFIVEIKSLKRILTALRGDVVTLCCIDEILRGTNTVERIAASARASALPGRAKRPVHRRHARYGADETACPATGKRISARRSPRRAWCFPTS